MKTKNFFLIHMYLIRQRHYKTANWLLRKVIEDKRPSVVWHGLGNDSAWHVSGIAVLKEMEANGSKSLRSKQNKVGKKYQLFAE